LTQLPDALADAGDLLTRPRDEVDPDVAAALLPSFDDTVAAAISGRVSILTGRYPLYQATGRESA
jgi:hypothetical protein